VTVVLNAHLVYGNVKACLTTEEEYDLIACVVVLSAGSDLSLIVCSDEIRVPRSVINTAVYPNGIAGAPLVIVEGVGVAARYGDLEYYYCDIGLIGKRDASVAVCRLEEYLLSGVGVELSTVSNKLLKIGEVCRNVVPIASEVELEVAHYVGSTPSALVGREGGGTSLTTGVAYIVAAPYVICLSYVGSVTAGTVEGVLGSGLGPSSVLILVVGRIKLTVLLSTDGTGCLSLTGCSATGVSAGI
jgi:hypothetical protein